MWQEGLQMSEMELQCYWVNERDMGSTTDGEER